MWDTDASLQIKDLMLITHALNGFYDIYSENYYDSVLKEQGVIWGYGIGNTVLGIDVFIIEKG